MNITRYDLIKSLGQYKPVTFFVALITISFIFPFYAGWIIYFLSEAFYLRKRARALIYRRPSLETTQLLYKCRGNYYKCILMFLIALTEFLYFFAIMLGLYSTDPSKSLDKCEFIILLASDFSICTYVFALSFLFFMNTLTKHLINVCKSDYRIQLLPPIQHRLAILALILMVLAVIKLAIQDFDNVIVEIVSAIVINYEYVSLVRNFKQLYKLLKWRYEDMRLEPNYPLYKAHKRMALKYKYLTVFVMFGIFFLNIVCWCHIPITFFQTILEFNYPPHLLMPAVKPLSILSYIVDVCVSIGATQILLLVGVSLYYLAAVCWNKMVPYGKNRIYYVREPILSNSQEYRDQ